MHRALIGLGANLGDPQQNLGLAVQRLAESAGVLVAQSSWRETAPVGGPSGQPMFVNGAVELATSLPPEPLLMALQSIEHELGRQRAERWSARAVDLDLLLYDELVLDSEDLKLPHPRMAFRRFVLEPAAEIAPDMLHPTTGWTVARLFEHLVTAPPYLALAGLPGSGKTRLAKRLAEQSGSRLILDPAAGERTLESVAQRAESLSRAAWPIDRWTISDFWFDQALACGKSDDAAQREAEIACCQRRAYVMPPKLLAVLEPGLATSVPASSACSMRAIRELARRPDQGPVVWLSSDDLEGAATELLAAMEAMR